MLLGDAEKGRLCDLGVHAAIAAEFERVEGLGADWVDVTEVYPDLVTDGSLVHLPTTAIRATIMNGRIHRATYRIHDHSTAPFDNQAQVDTIKELASR